MARYLGLGGSAGAGAGGQSAGGGNQAVMEAVLSKTLSHPHIVRTHAYGVEAVTPRLKQVWIVQVRLGGALRGATARQRCRQSAGPLPPSACPHASPLLPALPLPTPASHPQDLCTGGSLIQAVLAGRFKRPSSGNTDLRAVLLTAQEIAAALAYLHACGVVHGWVGSVWRCWWRDGDAGTAAPRLPQPPKTPPPV